MTMGEFTFGPLTPSAFLARSSSVYRDRIAIVDGDDRFSYADFAERSHQAAGALVDAGIGPGDRVAALCTNSHVMLELHHAVPLAGAVLVSLNIRLSPAELVHIVGHSGSKLLVATTDLEPLARQIVALTGIGLVLAGGSGSDYEQRLRAAPPRTVPCEDERGLLAINYTSGTTGGPKGVMYHHRGAYLQALAMAFHTRMTPDSVYLWTLPMFHCNGWCFPWGVTAAGGRHVCLRSIDVSRIWHLLRNEGVTHFSAAPTVCIMIASAAEADQGALDRPVHVQTGGAPPTPALLARMAELNMSVTHLYGLTETFGPLAINDWKSEWDALPVVEQARLRARQGVGNIIAEQLRVIDGSGVDVPADGRTIGEIACRGNNVMLGYYRDEAATERASVNGWLRTGDLAVSYPDGYVEIRDRAKDIIISGGENISSVEVERVLDAHPAVLESAVVARPDPKWGEVPVAFITLRPGANVTPGELIDHVQSEIARFKVPREIVFSDLPKTSTGKIAKMVLRERAAVAAPGQGPD